MLIKGKTHHHVHSQKSTKVLKVRTRLEMKRKHVSILEVYYTNSQIAKM